MDVDRDLQQAVTGDEGALANLLEHVAPALRRRLDGKIAAKWRSVLELDDVLQVTYLEAFLRIREFQPAGEAAFVGWLLRIAENNLRDAVKELGRMKRPQPDRRVQRVGMADSCRTLLGMLSGGGHTPSRQFAQEDVCAHVLAALERLPPDYASVVRAYDLEQRPAEEVAAELGRSSGAMYMLRARAHQRMRELLGNETLFFSDGP